MIGDYILKGNFSDPFEEFFVEQLNSSTNETIYRLTQDSSRVPLFLVQNVVLIFKTGRDMGLLNQYGNRYYNICF